jgi:hypothetical protein
MSTIYVHKIDVLQETKKYDYTNLRTKDKPKN